mmetsp:Transcript_21234/g.71419  ORF Transcript_21234/g.71419 Transcript_21234/m.71419 type:complete len:255 (+) Transcript_21234:148-912(+)
MSRASWEMARMPPGKALRPSTSASADSTSRWLVGSSRRSRLHPDLSALARCTRPRSPPESAETRFSCAAPRRLKHAAYARALTACAPSWSVSCPSLISSCTVWDPSRPPRDWDTCARRTVSPRRTPPASGASSPAMTLSSVDLPEPLAPTRATRVPSSRRRSRSLKSVRPPGCAKVTPCRDTAPAPSSRPVKSNLTEYGFGASMRAVTCSFLKTSLRALSSDMPPPPFLSSFKSFCCASYSLTRLASSWRRISA